MSDLNNNLNILNSGNIDNIGVTEPQFLSLDMLNPGDNDGLNMEDMLNDQVAGNPENCLEKFSAEDKNFSGDFSAKENFNPGEIFQPDSGLKLLNNDGLLESLNSQQLNLPDNIKENFSVVDKQLPLLHNLYSEIAQHTTALSADHQGATGKASGNNNDLFKTTENKLAEFKSQSLVTISSLQSILAKTVTTQDSHPVVQNLNLMLEQYKPLVAQSVPDHQLQKNLISFAGQVHTIIQGYLGNSTVAAMTSSTSATVTPQSYAQTATTATSDSQSYSDVIVAANAAQAQSSQSINQMLGAMNTYSGDPLYMAMILFLYMATMQSQVIMMNLKLLSANKSVSNLFTAASSALSGLKESLPIKITYTPPESESEASEDSATTPATPETYTITTLYGAFEAAFGIKSDGKLPAKGPNGTPLSSSGTFTMSPPQATLKANLTPMFNLLNTIDPNDMQAFSTDGDGWGTNETAFNDAVTSMYSYIDSQITLVDPSLQILQPLPMSNGEYLIDDPIVDTPGYSTTTPTQLQTQISNSFSQSQTALTSVSNAATSTSTQLTVILQANQSQYGNLMGGATNTLSSLKALYRSIWAQ